MAGRSIVIVSWAALALFVVTIVPDVSGWHALDGVGAVVALGLFLISLPVWLYAFGLGVVRSGRGEAVSIGGLFFLVGSTPADVRRWLMGALGLSIVVAFATVWANAFAALEPMFPLALAGLWAARHGTFPSRDVDVRAPANVRRAPARDRGAR